MEEEYLVEYLNDIKVTISTKEEVKSIMKALSYFSLIDSANNIHQKIVDILKIA